MSKQTETPVLRVRGALTTAARDWLAVERPLEIRARVGDVVQVVSTTMRTPGDDRALAAGFLFGERVIRDRRELKALETAKGKADIESGLRLASVPALAGGDLAK